MRWLAGLALSTFILGACTGSPVQKTAAVGTPSPSPSFVRWLALPPTGQIPQLPSPSPAPPIPIPAGTPPCAAGQLEGKLFGQFGYTGHMDSPIDFRNRSEALCYLEGFPDLTILDGSGNAIAQAAGLGQRQTFFGDPPVVPILMETGTPALIAAPQLGLPARPMGQAELHVEWYDCRTPVPARLAVDLPQGGGRLTVDYAVKTPYSPTCDSPAAGAPVAALARGPLIPTGVQWPPDPEYIAVDITISVPGPVKRGSTLVYFVTVRNSSQTDYQLSPCPDYDEFLVSKKPFASFQLNCAAVSHIAAGSSVTFEMHLQVPAGVAAGPNELTWALGDGRLAIPVARAVVSVT